MKVLVFLLFAAVFICSFTNCYVIEMDGLKPNCANADKDHLLVKHPCSCTTYFVCLTDPPIPMECPNGLQFDEKLQTCDYAINVGCREGCHPQINTV